MAMEVSNDKGLLMDFCVKNNRSMPRFEITESGPPHDRVFVCQVLIDDKLVVGDAKEKTKKSAEHKAAKMALEALGHRVSFYQPNYISLLNQLSQKKKQSFSFVEVSHVGPAHNPEFTSRVKFGDSVFPLSSARRSKKQAQKEAAYFALQEMRRQFPNEIPDLPEVFIDDSGSENSSLSGSAGGDISGNRSLSENGFSDSASAISEYDALLHHLCQKQKWTLDFMDSGQTGAAHVRQFSCTVKIGSRSFPKSNMKKTKKLAKKEAAFLALKELKSEFPNDIPDLPKVFIDDSVTGQPSASSPVNNGCIQQSSESGLHTSETRYSEPKPNSSGLTHSNVQSPLAEFDIESIVKLDRGAYGQVVKAKKKLDDKFYAVKSVKVRNDNVLQEVKVLARLEHQNIVRYYNAWLAQDGFLDSSESGSNSSDFSRSSGTYLYIQMELCENGSLRQWMKNRNLLNKVNKSESLEIFRQIIEGVRYIHSQKLIHRDLKPANILFTKHMIVKIGDFGLVTRMTGEEEEKALERTRGTGTPSYMAPEQKDNKYENEVDIYPLGLILFELLWVFYSEHEKADHWKSVRQGVFPSGFEEQHSSEKYEINRMLSHDPKKRPSAEDLSGSFQKMKTLDSQTY